MAIKLRESVCIAVGFFLLLLIPAGLAALEVMMTTQELVRSSPYVAHVRVLGSAATHGPVSIKEYRLVVLENLKGQLPAEIRVKILLASHVIDPDGMSDPAGSEWILILGEKNAEGIYPLRSLSWGKIELYEDSETGKMMLGRNLTGFRGGPKFTLDEFRELVRNL